MLVVGVDGYSKGWVAIALLDGRFHQAKALRAFEQVLGAFPHAARIGVDIPIGLVEAGERDADTAARWILRGQASSVFLTPPRSVFNAPSHEGAVAIARSVGEKGISRQAFGLFKRIREVDFDVHVTNERIIEVHPEVSFRYLADARNPRAQSLHRKMTWAGQAERRALLERAGIVLGSDLGEANTVPPDDVLDAAVAAWSAARAARGQAVRLPDEPKQTDRGRPIAIWA